MCHTPAFDMRSNSRLLVCMWPNGPLTLLCVETLLTRIAEHAAPSALDGNEVRGRLPLTHTIRWYFGAVYDNVWNLQY